MALIRNGAKGPRILNFIEKCKMQIAKCKFSEGSSFIFQFEMQFGWDPFLGEVRGG